MFWVGVVLALCILIGTLSAAPVRQWLTLSAGIWMGLVHWGPDGWAWFVGTICVVGFVLSPVLWACFGGGFFVGNGGISKIKDLF